MTHIFEDEKTWHTLSIEEKLDSLHKSIGKLFAIAEETSHKNHVFVDAINLVHGRLDEQAKAIRAVQEHAD